MNGNINFFKEKKPWSIFKDNILDYYLTPYFYKILATRKPIVVIDCFAGKGRFEDGNAGSPLIIAEHIKEMLSKGRSATGVFIEKKYADDLTKNMAGYKRCYIVDGMFEKEVENILKLPNNLNVFLYVDPYGVKNLEFTNFERLKARGFNSLELLMNFNSFGFLREGCRLLKCGGLFEEGSIDQDYEVEALDEIEAWNGVAGGDYWQSIIKGKISGSLDIYKAEELFLAEYTKRLRQVFKYVINIPIKIKTKNLPKYRLVFATNHKDGLMLMVDNMNRAWKNILENEKEILERERSHQTSFEFNLDSGQGSNDIGAYIMEVLCESKRMKLEDLLVEVIQNNGIDYSSRDIKEAVKTLELKGNISIERIPPFTKKTKKPATSFDYTKYDITLLIKEKR